VAQVTTAELVARAGPILFGRHWRADFCHTFALNERRLRRMLAGAEGVPEGLLRDVEMALRDHGTSLDGLLAEFP
jgi:hypothetical protein